MGLWNKLHFWKKEEDFDFDKLADKHFSGIEDPLNSPEKSLFPQEDLSLHAPTMAAPLPSKDLDLINSKLDTLKAMLTSIDQRLAALEKESKPPRLW